MRLILPVDTSMLMKMMTHLLGLEVSVPVHPHLLIVTRMSATLKARFLPEVISCAIKSLLLKMSYSFKSSMNYTCVFLGSSMF
jgi:hypothetical protein